MPASTRPGGHDMPHCRENQMGFESVDDLDEYLKEVADDTRELVGALKSLPDDYAERGCDGHGAGGQTAEIEELRSRVEEHFSRLPDCLAFLVEEIQRLSRNLDAISENRGRLHSDPAQNEFAEAQERLEAEYDRALKVHALLHELIELVGRALQLATAKGFAGAESPQQGGFPMPPLRPPSDTPGSPSSDHELDDLLSLGARRPTSSYTAAT